MAKDKVVGVAFTKKGRERKALQTAVRTSGKDPDRLTYAEDKRSGTSKVTDDDGRTVGRFRW